VPIDLPTFWTQVRRLARNDHTPVLMFCTTKFGAELIQSNPSWFRHDLVWDKQRGVSFLSANKMPLRSHEMVYVFAKKGAYYRRVDISGNFPEAKRWGKNTVRQDGVYADVSRTNTTASSGRRCVTSIISMLNTARTGRHPTEKPVTLYRWLLERYCPSGGAVLDPTFGSGNSGRAARELGLTYIGIEKDANFYAKARAALLGDEVADTIEHV
jgi:site-specific DNA-methyltransferase (adenine-specific)